MDIQFGQLKNVMFFLSSFHPQLTVKKRELTKKNFQSLLFYFSHIVDTLLKAENLYQRKNIILPAGKGFFPDQLPGILGNIILYLNKFDTRIFKFSRTERQTFNFVTENIIDYFRARASYKEKKSRENLFSDYKFWIENFFSIFDQKVNGTIQLKGDELIFVNPTVELALSPFIIFRQKDYFFLSGISETHLIYREIVSGEEIFVQNKRHDLLTFNFLILNFDFENARKIKERISYRDHTLSEKIDLIENAYQYQRSNRFEDSFELLKELPLEKINYPLVFLLQIRNLMALKKIFDLKRSLQKFVLLFPYYADVYEIMGDIYVREENFELALNYYEKFLNITQSKRVAGKIKKIKEMESQSKGKVENRQNDAFYDVMRSVSRSDEEIIGRGKALRQLTEILISNSRKNAILIGESGVGKTTLIRFLAQRIMNENVPIGLKGRGIKEINFVSLLTGSKYRGQFEEKVLKLLDDFKKQNSILVLEDIHLMMLSGAARGTSLDLVNILKPFLRDRTIQVIATTNYEEYKNSVEKDHSLMGFFQKINLNELSIKDTKTILKHRAKEVLARDNVIVSDEIIADIVDSARRSIKEKKLPDSAILIFERCISKVKLKFHSGELMRLEVGQVEVIEVLSDILNLPETHISLSLKHRLGHLLENLSGHIVGQDEALTRVVANVMTSKLDFDVKKNRPDGVFLFIGPTGVGKTETAIALAKALYGSEDYLIRIDMSEYMEKFTYSRFVGAAPGYVGYHDTNQLTDKVRQNPFSVILLDEIEKADAQLLNIFLQVFDAGRLTDARGNVVDFSHTTIIMTSNIGTSMFSKIQMGYRGDLDGTDVSRASLLKSLKRFFSPEFLNRIDEIVLFKNLKKEDVKIIIDIQLREVRENLEKQGKELFIADEVIDFIIKVGYSKEYGARNISRTLKNLLLEKLSKTSLEEGWDEARCVACSLNGDEVEFSLEGGGPVTCDEAGWLEEANVKSG
jgi:ATP-dependent Clp protease ATP-binding subunit ClpC